MFVSVCMLCVRLRRVCTAWFSGVGCLVGVWLLPGGSPERCSSLAAECAKEGGNMCWNAVCFVPLGAPRSRVLCWWLCEADWVKTNWVREGRLAGTSMAQHTAR